MLKYCSRIDVPLKLYTIQCNIFTVTLNNIIPIMYTVNRIVNLTFAITDFVTCSICRCMRYV